MGNKEKIFIDLPEIDFFGAAKVSAVIKAIDSHAHAKARREHVLKRVRRNLHLREGRLPIRS